MAVEWTTDPRAFASRDWTRLVEADPEGTFFHTPRYLKLYWEEFGAGNPQLGFVADGEETVAVAALDVSHGRLTFLGGTEVTDYMGPVGLPDARDRAAKELMAAIAGREDWRTADLRGLPEDGGWLRSLAAGARDAGLEVEMRRDFVAPFLELPRTFQEYLGSLPPKRRHELRRKARRLYEARPGVRVVESETSTLGRDLDRFVDLHRSSAGPKGRFLDPAMELFFRRLGAALIPEGSLRLTFLEAPGVKVAAILAFRDRDRLLLYNSAFDPEWGKLSPGTVLLTEVIREAIEEGLSAIDMLKGDLRYKYRFGASPRNVCRLVLRR